MGIFSKKADKKQTDKKRADNDQKARRTSDVEDDSAAHVDLEHRLAATGEAAAADTVLEDAVLEDEVSMHSLDYLDDTAELLGRSAPTVGSQAGAVEPWHLPDLSGPDGATDLGSAESFATFFGDDGENPVDGSTPVSPASFEATENETSHDRRTEDEPPMAAASNSAIAANSDFLSVEIDDLPIAGAENGRPMTASELIAAAPPSAIAEPVFAEETFSVREPDLPAAPVVSIEPVVAPTAPMLGQNERIAIDVDQHGPVGSRAETLLEILGLAPNASWQDIGTAHATLTRELADTTDGDPSREAVSRAIQREMNTAYAALRLMAVA